MNKECVDTEVMEALKTHNKTLLSKLRIAESSLNTMPKEIDDLEEKLRIRTVCLIKNEKREGELREKYGKLKKSSAKTTKELCLLKEKIFSLPWIVRKINELWMNDK